MASVRPEFVNGVPGPRPKTLRNSDLQIVRDDLSGLLSHDLKTPLAAIAMNLDFALAELDPHTSEGVRSALDDCRHANTRAIRIVTDMADAVRLAVGDKRAVLADVALAAVIRAVAEHASDEAASRGVRVCWTADETVVRGDIDLLSRALDRLLERALRHARCGSRIDVEQRAAGIAICVETMSDGIGEPSGRTLATYFAEAAIRAQGGGLWTEPHEGSLVFRVSLPR